MDIAVFLTVFFLLAVFNPLFAKVTAHQLDPDAAPIYISVWTFLGLAITYPFFAELLVPIELARSAPIVFLFAVLKGPLLWLAAVIHQKVRRESLSTSHYALPVGLALIVLGNAALGETLHGITFLSAIALSLLGVLFVSSGPGKVLSSRGRIKFIYLVLLLVLLGMIDRFVLAGSNWYLLLCVSNLTLLITALLFTKAKSTWVSSFTNRAGIACGLTFVLYELIKFYPMVTKIPVSVITSVEVSTIPVVLILSSIVWKEGTVRSQLVWGLTSLVLMVPIMYWR
jgi:hypothetical protein